MIAIVYSIWTAAVIGLAVMLSGCEQNLSGVYIEKCQKNCEDHGGLSFIHVDAGASSADYCYCQDQTLIKP